MLVGASIAMATAMQATGGADAIAAVAVGLLDSQPPAVFMAGLFLVVAILTNVLSNNATAVLFTPVAIAAAQQLGVDPLPFVVSVIWGPMPRSPRPSATRQTFWSWVPVTIVSATSSSPARRWSSSSGWSSALVAPWYYGV